MKRFCVPEEKDVVLDVDRCVLLEVVSVDGLKTAMLRERFETSAFQIALECLQWKVIFGCLFAESNLSNNFNGVNCDFL